MRASTILLRSARRRMGDAALLAVSTAVSVMAIQTFVAAAGSKAAAEAVGSNQGLVSLFIAAAIVTALFAALSGWFFAEHYLSRRKRELATWILVGMGKRAAFGILACEFAAAALVAFLAGTGAGILLSRFFALALAALMRERSPVDLPFGAASVGIGALACGFQFILASARAAFTLSRVSITTLMRSGREAETQPRARPFLAGVGALLIILGYSGALFTKGGLAMQIMLPVLAATVIGTFLCFGAIVPTLAAAARKQATSASRGGKTRPMDAAGLVATAQIAFRSRRNARLLALTAVLVAVAATASGTVIALNISDSFEARRICPHSIELPAPDQARVRSVEEALASAGARAGEPLVLDYLAGELAIEGDKVYTVSVFSASSWSAALGALDESVSSIFPGSFRSTILERLSLPNGEEAASLSLGGLSKRLSPDGGEFRPPVSLILAKNPLVLADSDYAAFAEVAEAGSRKRVALWDDIDPRAAKLALPAIKAMSGPKARVRVAILDEQDALNGALLFIGIFLAAVFVLCAVSLLLFRVIEDARDDGERYRILAELGAPLSEVRRSLVLQDIFTFGLPFAFGLCHCAAALVMMRHISGYESTGPTLVVAAAALAIFVLTGLFAVDRQLATSWKPLRTE